MDKVTYQSFENYQHFGNRSEPKKLMKLSKDTSLVYFIDQSCYLINNHSLEVIRRIDEISPPQTTYSAITLMYRNKDFCVLQLQQSSQFKLLVFKASEIQLIDVSIKNRLAFLQYQRRNHTLFLKDTYQIIGFDINDGYKQTKQYEISEIFSILGTSSKIPNILIIYNFISRQAQIVKFRLKKKKVIFKVLKVLRERQIQDILAKCEGMLQNYLVIDVKTLLHDQTSYMPRFELNKYLENRKKRNLKMIRVSNHLKCNEDYSNQIQASPLFFFHNESSFQIYNLANHEQYILSNVIREVFADYRLDYNFGIHMKQELCDLSDETDSQINEEQRSYIGRFLGMFKKKEDGETKVRHLESPASQVGLRLHITTVSYSEKVRKLSKFTIIA